MKTNIYKALANFQQACPVILKDTQGFNYVYSDLPAIYKVIMPLLKENGLGFTQVLKEKGLETILFHIESGETIAGYVEIPTDITLAKMNQYQVMGSAYTYYRRYALSSMLGIITDKDTDANNQPEKQPVKQVAKPVEKTKSQIIAGLCKDLGLTGSTKLDYDLFIAGKTGKPLTEDNFDYIIEKLNLLIK